MIQFLQKIQNIEDSVLNEYLSNWEPFEIKRKSIITFQGKTEKYLYLLKSGVQKVYFENDGKTQVVAFVTAPSFSGIFESLYSQKPSNYFLESVTDCSTLRITYKEYLLLLEENPEIERLFRKALELTVVGLSNRQFELIAFDMETRFKNFMERSSYLLNIIPHKDIASYLNMDATNFSKLLKAYPLK